MIAMESRLSEIEIKLSFTEDLVEELNRTVVRQQQQLVDLEQQVRGLRLQLQSHLPAEAEMPGHEIPPHY